MGGVNGSRLTAANRAAGSVVVIFGIADTVMRFIPVMPTFGTDTSSWEGTVHEDCVGIVTPRTTKVHLIYIRGKGDGAFVEDIAILHVLRSGSSGDV